MPGKRRRAGADHLFVYGTLMRGFALHRVLAPSATLVAEGTVRGRLLSFGPYPGLVDGSDRVKGELYRIDDGEVLTTLDREEGYNFVRRHAAVTLTDGRRTRAWIYRYRGPRVRAVAIPEGDWRSRWR